MCSHRKASMGLSDIRIRRSACAMRSALPSIDWSVIVSIVLGR